MINRVELSTGLAVGSAGSATATGYSVHVAGKVLAVYVDFQDSPPAATTDFTLSDEADPASESITGNEFTVSYVLKWLYPCAWP